MGLDGTHVMMQSEKVEPTSLVVVSKGCYKKKETSTKKIGGSSSSGPATIIWLVL